CSRERVLLQSTNFQSMQLFPQVGDVAINDPLPAARPRASHVHRQIIDKQAFLCFATGLEQTMLEKLLTRLTGADQVRQHQRVKVLEYGRELLAKLPGVQLVGVATE